MVELCARLERREGEKVKEREEEMRAKEKQEEEEEGMKATEERKLRNWRVVEER